MTNPTDGAERPLLAIFIIWFAGLGAASQYARISVVFDHMQTVYPQAGGWLGFTLSIVGVVGVLLGVVAGTLAARLGPRRVIFWGLIFGAAVAALQAIGLSLGLFLLTRVIEGISHLAIVVAGPTLLARVAPQRLYGFAFTLWGAFFAIAYAFLAWVAPPIVARWGLDALHLGHAGWLMICAGLIWMMHIPAGERAKGAPLTVGYLMRRHWEVYRSPFMNASAFGWLFYAFCFLSMLTLLPPHLDPEWRSETIAAMPLLATATSMTLGVRLLHRMPAFRVVQIGFFTATGVVVMIMVFGAHPAICLGYAMAMGLMQGSSFALVPQINTNENDRAGANGAFAQAGNLGNTIGTPVLLLVASVAGFNAMLIVVALVLVTGGIGHQVLAVARKRQSGVLL